MRSVDWIDGNLRFIDQTRLPHEEVFIDTNDINVVAGALKALRIRGAPAIGVAAAFAVVMAVDAARPSTLKQCGPVLNHAIDLLGRTRPTAVNLFASLNRMKTAFERSTATDVAHLREELLVEARTIQREDIEACARIGELGSSLIAPGSSILTHCNTGLLATAGEGTALGIITTAAKRGNVVQVFVDETRPLFQGSRLTAWELSRHGIKTIVITDSAAGVVLQKKKVQAVIVGADRIAANGDVANKIGTYSIAVIASRHGIPFYVAAPTSTIDSGTPAGGVIDIEERNSHEITHVAGVRIAAEGVSVYAPAFDDTPNELITAIVTEKEILRAPYRESIVRCLGGK